MAQVTISFTCDSELAAYMLALYAALREDSSIDDDGSEHILPIAIEYLREQIYSDASLS